MDLTTATPIEIDTDLVKAYRRIADLTSQQHRINATVSRIDEVEPGSYQSMLPGNSPEIRAKLVGEIEALQERIQKIRRLPPRGAVPRPSLDPVLPRRQHQRPRPQGPGLHHLLPDHPVRVALRAVRPFG
jgi:hypothetical protein